MKIAALTLLFAMGTGGVMAEDKAITQAVNEARIIFDPAVFSGEKFPPCDLKDRARLEKALGKCVLTAVFYDAGHREVTTAAKPGRYGAIVEVAPEHGPKFKRFATLYRTPQELNWKTARVQMKSVEFPPELGLDPAVVAKWSATIEESFNDLLRSGLKQGSDLAVLFAGLAELKPDDDPARWRTGPWALDQQWWFGLKKQTGNLRDDYYVHLPADYEKEPARQWPLLLFLHGSGERGYDPKAVMRHGPPREAEANPDYPFIVIAPQCSPGEWFSPPELADLLDRVEEKYRVDPSRVYLTGLSMGGYGSWMLATGSPERFAAVVPICGGGDPHDVERIKDLPIWAFHGAKDTAVPLERSQEMVDALRKVGSNVKFTIFPDAGHDSWTQAYATPELTEWIMRQQRPERKK